jgi:hypothetical protein
MAARGARGRSGCGASACLAKALGLDVSAPMLARADEVIE